jgi:hypothetical protein
VVIESSANSAPKNGESSGSGSHTEWV